MNHIYRSIWCAATATCVASSEHVSGAGKAVSSATEKPGIKFRCHKLSFALMLVMGAWAHASPTGGLVTAGKASISGKTGQMTITQTTAHAAIQWQSFGIRAGESVQFVQPSSSSVALNRVIGTDPSVIMGSLSSNGKVFLVNPSGILFGPGASVNVGSLVASTLNISDADFMAGRYQFSGSSNASVVNQGLIQAAEGGYVALLGS